MKTKGESIPVKYLDGDDFISAGDQYPTLRAEVERIMKEKYPDREIDLERVAVSEPNAYGVVRVFVPYK